MPKKPNSNRRKVIGPQGSAQLGKSGTIIKKQLAKEVYPHAANNHSKIDPNSEILTIRLDGEDKDRNFKAADLTQE